ncbi:ABC transporter permease [Subdoligranulum variabile]|uniref:ABC transporter permease n=1 Tax=Subdoligranulum variabile TaxID=214851 RepID=UPI002942C3DC|nr:ABC transporter permease subunit [Subdoligranulum variabile]
MFKTASRKLLQRKKSDRAQNWQLFLMVLPMMIVVTIFSYIPLAGLIVAFKDYSYRDGILASPFCDPLLKNFEFLFKSPDTFRIIRNTLGYNFAFIALTLVISVAIAILLNEVRSRKALKVYQTTMFIPYFLSWVVVSYIVYAFLNPRLGYLNAIAAQQGGETLDWYNTPQVWVFIIIFLQIWKTVGMNVLMYYASLMSIDASYYEAAAIEGASRWQMIKRITLPMLYPMMIILTILAVGKIMNSDFGLFYQVPMDSKTLYATTDVLETYVYRALIDNGNIGMSSAAGFLKSVVGFVLVMITNGIVKKINPDYALY